MGGYFKTNKQANKQHPPPPRMYNTAKPHCYKIWQNTVIDKNQIGSTHLPTSKHIWRAAMLGKRRTDCKETKMLKTQIQPLGTVKNPNKLPRVHTGNFLCFYWMLETPNGLQIQSDSFYVISHKNATGSNHSTITQMPTSALFLQKSNLKNPNTKNLRQITQSLTDLQDNCKQKRLLWILPSILLPPFSPHFSQGRRLLWIVTLPAEQQHCRRWLSLGFPQDKTLEMLGAEGRNVAFLFLHFTFLCPDTSTLLISCCHHVSQVSGSGTHTPKTSTVQEVSAFHEMLHCIISHTPRELLQISFHTLPFCSLDCYCQSCSLFVVRFTGPGHPCSP